MAKRKTTPDAERSFAKHVVISPQGLNLREGPGKDYSVSRVLKAGETVQPEGDPDKNGWMPVRGGWVDSQYLREV